MDEALSDDAEIHDVYDMELPSIVITHRPGQWEIDHVPCITSPVLNFEKIPNQVTRLEARLYSPLDCLHQGVHAHSDANYLIDFDPDCEHKRESAYNGNVNLDAWAKDQESN